MVLLTTPLCDFGWKAAHFDLAGVDGQHHRLEGTMGPNGLLVVFLCNHCPYVKAIRPRLVRDLSELKKEYGIHAIAIMSNDPTEYTEDSFDNMKRVAEEFGFGFPYVWDQTQGVARAYGAVCTPDFFGFNRNFELQYRGRFDESGRGVAPEGARRDLFEAMKQVAETQQGPREQIPSMGCSIKWRET
jgi:peroxiredoxin